MRFHEAVGRSLADHGVSTVFGVIGDANLYMMDSFQRYAGGRYVSVSHEASAILAASGYAQVSGSLGVATVTHGPGLTNTVTALVDSVRSHTPVLLLAGDTAVTDRANLQKIAQRDLVLCTGAGFEQVRSPNTLVDDMSTAIRRALAERRPVVLNVPADLQWEEVELQEPQATYEPAETPRPDPKQLDRAVGIIAAARRPIVLAGRGATDPRAREALLHLARRIGAPVATSLRAKDLFRGEPHNLGICGTFSSPVALDTITRSDCLIAFGAGLNPWTTVQGSILDGRRIVQVDIDASAINKWGTADAGVVGDAATVAETVVAWLNELDVATTGFASDGLAKELAERSREELEDCSTEQTVDVRTAMLTIDGVFPQDRTLVCDGGRFMGSSLTRVCVQDPHAYVHTLSFGSIGLGLGTAIGASCAAPGRATLLIAGDGGFMLGGLAEFSTAVRHKLDLVVVVVNDGAYGAEHVQFRSRDMDPSLSTFSWPDLGPVATALGGLGFTVRSTGELDAALSAIANRDRPMLIDIKVDVNKVPPLFGH